MEAEDDSASDGNLVSFRSEIHPLILDSVCDSLVLFDFSRRPTVRGRLKLCIPFWCSLGTLQFILNVIGQGYRFPSSNYRHLFSRRRMLRCFPTVHLCPKLLMNCSTLTLLKRPFACLTLSARFLFPRVVLVNRS